MMSVELRNYSKYYKPQYFDNYDHNNQKHLVFNFNFYWSSNCQLKVFSFVASYFYYSPHNYFITKGSMPTLIQTEQKLKVISNKNQNHSKDALFTHNLNLNLDFYHLSW